jgi:hypothetical protein
MTPTPDAIEAALQIPESVAAALLATKSRQDRERGNWASPREVNQPQAPGPTRTVPVLRYLLFEAEASVEAGMDVGTTMLHLAVHAWFEGGVEDYDRGQRDARTPRAAT